MRVVRFLEAIPSLKSRTALTTVYATGLRVSEVVLLKIADIDSQRMVIRVEQGKGGKDRYVMLSPQLLRILRTYWRLARPKRWLFPGRDDERPLVPNVLHAACRSACAAAGLSKQVRCTRGATPSRPISWRGGADVRIIQVLLGHASLSSTARYTRVATKTISNTPSPLDRLRLEVVPPGCERGAMAPALEVGGYLPPPWRSNSCRRTPAISGASSVRIMGRHHGVPDGGARRPCRAVR